MIDPEFLRMLVCPSSRQPLREATAAELEAVNRAIAAGGVRNRGGTTVTAPLSAGLVPAGGGTVYPIQDGIPILLSAEAVPLPGGAGPGPAKGT
ncbi:MAG: hypothetical protein FJ265_01650 [Planctomycetes bacterium]|nr:hypothetical protein [Planctomycetota bacterium]